MSESKQEIRDAKIGGKVVQTTDATKADQKISGIEATALNQKISSQTQTLGLGKYKAQGLYAVVGLVFLALVYMLFQFLTKK